MRWRQSWLARRKDGSLRLRKQTSRRPLIPMLLEARGSPRHRAENAVLGVLLPRTPLFISPLRNRLVAAIGPEVSGFFMAVKRKATVRSFQARQRLKNAAQMNYQMRAQKIKLLGEILEGFTDKKPLAVAGVP